jgi:type I restriction enzyme M protein
MNIFFEPKEAHWDKTAKSAHTAEVGVVINNTMHAIEKENSLLKGVLPKNRARPELDKRKTGDIVDIFTNISMKKHI